MLCQKKKEDESKLTNGDSRINQRILILHPAIVDSSISVLVVLSLAVCSVFNPSTINELPSYSTEGSSVMRR